MKLKLNNLFKKKLKNESGSALPFVLIIGLIMMILVGAITAVAVGGIQFTQESVESRQAYLDAKSVIEFARIEINENYETTKAAYTFSKDKSTFIRPVGGPLFYVYGVPRTSAGDDLKLRRVEIGNSGNPGEVRLGTAILVEDFNNPGTSVTDITLQYHYEIMTENLERQLNYKTGFSYIYKEIAGTGGGMGSNLTKIAAPTLTELQALGMPKLSDAPNSSGWPLGKVIFDWYTKVTEGNDLYYTSTSSSADIHGTKENGSWVLNVPKSGSDLKLQYSSDWTSNIKLTFQASNLETPRLPSSNNCQFQYDVTGTLYINGDLNVSDGSKVIINANKVIVNGGITVNSGGVLTITANEGVYVNNDVDIKSGNTTANTISAKNIYIGGSLKTSNSSQTKIVVSATNIYINGNISLLANQSISKLTAETLVVKNNSSGSVKAIDCSSASETLFECSRLWLNGSVDVRSTSAKIVFNRLYYFECKGVNLGDATKLELNGVNDSGNRVFIDGSLSVLSVSADVKINNISYVESKAVDLKNGTNFTFNGLASGGSRFIVKGDVYHSGAGLFSLNNLYWFECNNLTFDTKAVIDIHTQVVKVANKFTFTSDVNRNSVIDVQYLYAGGMTEFRGGDILVVFTCKSFPGKGNFIFAGGYYQQNAKVIFENAENIIIQGIITFETNCRLDFNADKIYLDSNKITHGDSGNSTVSFGGINNGTGTDFYIKSLISWTDTGAVGSGNYLYQIGNGVYKSVAGESLKTLDKKTKLPYVGPGEIKIPGTGGSSPTETGEVVAINNSSIYY